MQQTQIDALRAKVMQARQDSKLDITKVDMPYRASAEGRRNQAVKNLPDYENELTTVILQNSALILLSDKAPNALEFAEYIKSKESKTIILDYLSIDKRLFNRIFQGIRTESGYPFNSESYSRINSVLYEVGIELGVRSMMFANTDAKLYGVIKTSADSLARITKILNTGAAGDGLRQLYLNKQLRDQVLTNLDNSSVAIVMVNVPDTSMAPMGLLAGRYASVFGEDSEGNGLVLSGNSDFDSIIKGIQGTFVKDSNKTKKSSKKLTKEDN